MAFSLKIGDEFLDIIPATQLQLTENNPFLQLASEIVGQYSLPFTAPLTEKNIRLLQWSALIQKTKADISIPAYAYDGNIQHSSGQIKFDQINGNLAATKNGTVSLFYLYGISDFYQVVKDRRLPSVDLGVKEVWDWVDDLIITQGGFWVHMHDVMFNGNPDNSPYAVFEASNDSDITTVLTDNPTPLNYNTVNWYNTHPENPLESVLVTSAGNKIVVFPYLVPVLQKLFSSVGWKVQGDILSDPDFRKIVLLNSHQVPNSFYYPTPTPLLGKTVTLTLSDHLPNVTISGFLISLKNRLGWWYDFDYHKKICTIKFVKDVFATRVRKDYTSKVSAPYLVKITDKKIYTISASQGDQQPDWTQLAIQGVQTNMNGLPAPTADLVYNAWFVCSENSWFICATEDEGDTYIWQKIVGNTYGYENAAGTDAITTDCNIPDMNDFDFNVDLFSPMGMSKVIPCFDIPIENGETDVFYMCYHHGPVKTWNPNGIANRLYPYGSPGPYDPNGNKIGNATLSFFFKDVDGTEIGVYEIFWRFFLEKLQNQEISTFDFYFSTVELLTFSMFDSIIINGTEWFIQVIRRNLPSPGPVETDAIRIS